MGKSKNDTVKEACPSIDHDQKPAQPPNSQSHLAEKIKTAAKSEKSRKNRSKADMGHESSATLKPAGRKRSKFSGSRKFHDSSRGDETFQDIEHESSVNNKVKASKVSKKSNSSLETRHLRDSNTIKTGEAFPNQDHNSYLSLKKSMETKLEDKPLEAIQPEECHHADHRQPADDPKTSTTTTKLKGIQALQEFVNGEAEAASIEVKQSSTNPKESKASFKKMADKLKNSNHGEDCGDSDHDASPNDSKKARKAKKKKEKQDKKEKKRREKLEKKEKKQKYKEQKDKTKGYNKAGVTSKPSPSLDDFADPAQWLSPSETKKLKKLIKSREEKMKKLEDIMKLPKESKTPKSKGKDDRNSVQAHDLSDCRVIHTNDGPSSRKVSKLDLAASAQRTPAQAFPRGIQIIAKNTNTLEGGFPYPTELALFGIAKADWMLFCFKLTEPLADKRIAYAIEKILDICAEEDVRFFRPKGFIMRLDMPGEEQYGLDMMDIYHPKLGTIHTDNFSTMPPNAKEDSGAIKHKHQNHQRKKDRKHLETLRDRAFRSTRLMLDPIIFLRDPELAIRRGWARWIIASNQAKQLAQDAPPKRIDNKPWFGYFPARWDRWPPSKHLYYDRFRGSSHMIGSKCSRSRYIVPDPDSMDQRGTPYSSSVLPCDEVEFVVLHPGQP